MNHPRHGPVTCLLGLHKYHAHATDEGVKFLVCSRCGKESFPEGMDRSHFGG